MSAEGMFGSKPKDQKVIQPGYYHDITNAEYHGGPGVSKSQLDLIAQAPAVYLWGKEAPEDATKSDALILGDAFHAMLLEPERFHEEYYAARAVDRRTKEGKAAWASMQNECGNRTILHSEDVQKLNLMRESVMAHPDARKLVEMAGDIENSIYWKDPDTGLLCRCRPDKTAKHVNYLIDLKTTADIDRFAKSVAQYRYHVQDAFYTEGYKQCFGEKPGFMFLAVSTSINCGKYPVRVFELDNMAKETGAELFRRDLNTLEYCVTNDDYPGVESLSLPDWYYK